MHSQDEFIIFSECDAPIISEQKVGRCWRILIVDDDADVHDSTEFALRGLLIHNRPLELLHTYSADETIAFLRKNTDIAAVLLDVVMETVDAGLTIVKTIRDDLGMTDVRIILRTGQPGYAPEMDVISRYEINDYKIKSELTRTKLYTSLTTAIRSYDQLQRLTSNRTGLKLILDASNAFITSTGLNEFAQDVIVQIANFIDIKPEGLVCTRSIEKGKSATHIEIIGASGRYVHLINQSLARFEELPIRELIQRCLDTGQSILEEYNAVLFCPGRSENDFATFVHSDQPILERDQDLIELFCANIGLYGDNITLISHLREMATVDHVLKIPNRLALIETINKVTYEGRNVDHIIALLDIDRFAEINDVLGSRYGNQLLQAIAQRLRENSTDFVMIARVAGGGFGVLGDANYVHPQALHALFQPPLTIDGIESLVTISMGLVSLQEFKLGGEELLQCASIALKRAKTGDQLGQSAYYTLKIRDEIHDSALLLHELSMALKTDPEQFFMVYQPQIDLKSGKANGVEALVRWRKPDGTVIQPDHFIPITVQSGLIVSLGELILRWSLSALHEIHRAGFTDICMAVNVSAVQFCHPDFIASVDSCLCNSSVNPGKLELEITESSALIGMEMMQHIFAELKSRRINIAIDDFGTGYSSMSYLDKLPADRLKIDRAFIMMIGTDQPGARITEMVIPLGQKLGMKVLAEGVEESNQVNLLRELGCDEIQGYYTGRPMELSLLLDWLEKYKDGVLDIAD